MTRQLLPAVALLFCLRAACAQEMAPLPTGADLHKSADAGDYREALLGLQRVLAFKGPAAQPYDILDLMMLKAECQLQLKNIKPANDALDALQKEAAARGNADVVGDALALQLLLKRSPGFRYAPKTTNGPIARSPINILDRAVRKDAYKALFQDELAGVRQTVRAAEASKTVPPVVAAAKSVATLHALERVAGDKTPQTDELAATLVRRAGTLLAGGVIDLSAQVDSITSRANVVVTMPMIRSDPLSGSSWVDQVQRRRGLENDDAARLRAVDTTCGQIVVAVNDLTLTLQAEAQALNGIASDAAAVKARAAAALDDRYDR